MPSVTFKPEDQLTFLLSCIRYSNGGKVDFGEVAKETGSPSKGAAAKRYERLLKANGIDKPGQTQDKLHSIRNATVASTQPKQSKPRKPAEKGKKRTFAEYEGQNDTGDDDEELPIPKGKAGKKEEVKEEVKVKREMKDEEGIPQYDGCDEGFIGSAGLYAKIEKGEEYEKAVFGNFVKLEMSNEDNEGQCGGFEEMDVKVPFDSVGLVPREGQAFNNSLVITD